MKLLRFPRLWLAASLFLFLTNTLSAQTDIRPRETALRFLQENPVKFGLTKQDVADVRVTDEYPTKHNGVTHVWVQQQHLGIPVFNGLFGLHVKSDGSVFTVGHRFVPELASKVNTSLPSLSAAKAVEMAMANLGFSGFPVPSLRQKINERNFIFEGGSVSKRDIVVSACYERQGDNALRLAWMLVVEPFGSSDIWNMRVDAQTGLILGKNNRTVYCQAGHAHSVNDVERCEESDNEKLESTTSNEQRTTNNEQPTTNNQQLTSAAESYNVFALPVESPAHGARQILVNPADPTASPFGWHDTNGAAGPEYTYTRGNNVYAYDDRDDNNQPPATPFPDAGPSLNFNYPFDPNAEPLDNLNAAITNLFYMNNMMHDITYRFGFDEPAGNFQHNTYGNGGQGNDAVQANAIDGYALPSQNVNNANFSTDPDGFSGRMQMYVWTRSGGQLLTVNAPAPVAGVYSASTSANWGQPVSDVPVTGEVEIVNDGSGNTLGCNDLVNDLTGKIALVDRGVCEFGRKALNAQQAGAIGCIICNNQPGLVTMGAGAVGGQVNIPVIMLSTSDCNVLRQFAGADLNVSLQLTNAAGPNLLDGDFDNGIIAHEYGHGISNRLTGGPNNTDCLFNLEQMGEGWSDFFTLITSVKPGDVANKNRGIGTYVLRQANDEAGIRRYPYTTDMSANPLAFDRLTETPFSGQQHSRGEIWTTVLWDLYWAMVEKYGYDADLSNTNSGNFRAVQLVMDGMKLQPCEPGNIDGRNGIMAADVLNYGGADTCLISAVFARRGMGYLADQGSSFSAADGTANFDPIPTCIKELKIKKETTTPLIEPGENAQFLLTVTNHKDETASNVVVTDEVPNGLSFTNASNGGTFSNGIVTWNLGDMAPGQVIVLTYNTKSADAFGSVRYYHDVMESDNDWISINPAQDPQDYFVLQSAVVKSGSAAWKATSVPEAVRFTLEPVNTPLFTVSGSKPILRFWHQYSTQRSIDAGIVEVQISGETAWSPIPPDKVFRNPYSGSILYTTFAIPSANGFSGVSNDWVQSYFDLSDYNGKEISLRFHFGTNTDESVNPQPEGFWYVDEIEAMDMLNFDGEACVSSGSDQACAKAPGRGVIVQPGIVSTDEPDANQLPMQVQPNPASDFLHLSLGQALSGLVRIQLVGTDGRTVLSRNLDGIAEGQIVTLDVQQIPVGVYAVRLESAAGSSVKKVVIR
jgi:uncharacterized repeat protein (TIGR01451 family)